MGYNRLMDAINFNKLTPAQSTLLARIRHSIATNPLAVEKAVLVLFSKQDPDERRDSDTKRNNSRGFNAVDASRLSYYGRWLQGGRHFNVYHLGRARSLVGKYWRQLLVVALAKQENLSRAA